MEKVYRGGRSGCSLLGVDLHGKGGKEERAAPGHFNVYIKEGCTGPLQRIYKRGAHRATE
ncbi:hypothetical protein EMIT0P100_10377 [Pseudomonas sp. IT-P100]